MAVVTESFSIREYVERMRSIDLRRCWPFDDGSEARPLLPSISVRRFKWWGDELDSARSTVIVEEDDDPSNDAAVAANSEADDILQRPRTAMEPSAAPTAGEEGRRAANKTKQRMPKKRSIVELFAAVPLIAGTVDSDEANSDDGESWEEEDTIEEEEKIDLVMRKKKTMKENIIKKKKRRKKKNKGIKDGHMVEICAWEKEKICKPKMAASVQNYMFQSPVCSKKSRKTARNSIESQIPPTKEKVVVRKKHKASRTSKLLFGNQEVSNKLPVRSILKKQKRGAAGDRKSSRSVNAKAAELIKFYSKSNRRVTFSVEDDVAGTSRACSAMDFPQLQSLCKIFSDVLAASSAMNHSGKGHDLPDANEKTQEAKSCEKERVGEASSTEKNQSSDSVVNLRQPTVGNSSNSSCSGADKPSFAVMVDLNHAISADDIDCNIPATSTFSTSCIYSGDPSSRANFHEKNPNSTSGIHLEACLTSSSSEPGLLLPAASSMKHQKNLSSHSSTSCLIVHSKTNERQCRPDTDDADANSCRRIEEQGRRFPKGSLCYSTGSKNLGESLFSPNYASTSKSKCPGEGLIGLPLNSQGELIQFHSGTKFSEAYNKQNMEWGSIHSSPASRQAESNGRMKNHLEMMRKKIARAASASHQKSQSDWNQKQCYSTRERVRHWLNFTEMDGSERFEIQKNEPLKGKDVFPHCNSNPRRHSFHEHRNGDASSHDFCDRADYHAPPAVQPTMRLMGKNVVVGGANIDFDGFNDGRTWNHDENFAGKNHFPAPENPLPQQWMPRDCASHPTIGRSKGNLLDLLDSPPNFHHMKSLEPTLDYMNIPRRPPQWPSGSTDSAIVSHTYRPGMNDANQFLGNTMSGEGSNSTGLRRPAIISSHPQNCRQHMPPGSSPCKHNQRVSAAQSQFKHQDFGKFSQPQPPLSQQPEANLPQWLLQAKHQKRTQPPHSHYSDPNAINQPSNVNKRNICMKKKGKEINHSADARKLTKRAADFDHGVMNSSKRPLREGLDPHIFEEPKGAEAMNRAISFEFLNTEKERKGSWRRRSVNSSSNSLKFDSELRSGPAKLMAGAKHILRPCERMEEENCCRPIHSTRIVPTADNSGKLFGPEKNISNIYYF